VCGPFLFGNWLTFVMLNILGHNNVLVAYTSANKAMPVSSCVTIAKQGARYYGDNVYCTVYCGAMLLM